ncbi:putative hydroxymethylpyrimidine transport system permease protein [Rhodobium orientis]|uniref:ABC transporter permease n=1 Tax=Rhodobium orientis TaxID=34017 RepID=A0A327JWQ4_9HYPH|nr:ABC transporter permease [Rhodobium orientis]MBB4303037.1 putative hydroxymethylpyrimidine transport system permease protein [Rhodobium orientis]MBK5949595.1 ABC transporter permease [Rhodobium orientis]RAI29382.1 ABC transporter permease [Rhodobium orientis]
MSRVFWALARALLIAAALVALWQAVVTGFALPHYMLPSPERVAAVFRAQPGYLATHGLTTFLEIVVGLATGALLGVVTALVMSFLPLARKLVLPVVVASQALPVFAIAPLLVVWFGFGMASKIVMASLIIYFPVASSFYDGLTRTDRGLVELAGLSGASRWQTLIHIRIPAALPNLASGLRVAVAVAPIGAVVGEWVGASSGLGFVMIQANARMQTDTVFAALIVLAVIAVTLRQVVDRATRRLVFWAPETDA